MAFKAFADGFDEDEIKPFPTVKPPVAKKLRRVVNRKRKADFPPSGLEVRTLQSPPPAATPTADLVPATTPPAPTEASQPVDNRPGNGTLAHRNRNLAYIHSIQNHMSYVTDRRDIEVFSTLSFPSEPNKTFASYVFEESLSQFHENLAVEYAKIVITLWDRSLHEKFYQPVRLLMDVIDFVIQLDPSTIVPPLVAFIVPVVHSTCHVNALPRHHAASHKHHQPSKPTPQSELRHEVSSTHALDLLYNAVSVVQGDMEIRKSFWQIIRQDFILYMLTPRQSIDDIICVFRLLKLSILSMSFGPVQESQEEQVANESSILEHVARLLDEEPQADEGDLPYTAYDISTLRVEAMSFLTDLASAGPNNPFLVRMASAPTMLPRIFRVVHYELESMCSDPPDRNLRASLVNGLTELAYMITRTLRSPALMPSNDADDTEQSVLAMKLRSLPGATQKFLVSMTRLTFCEEGERFLEEGIQERTVEMAHDMLEETIDLQEAEALLEVFRPPNSKE